tara:strand:+ start:1083 stop:1694 length:612 start_codon:yes stop_codon:yes gene_type:complete
MATQYSSIAKEFSASRYRTWPKVNEFIECIDKTKKSHLELGCGNGKNMLRYKELGFNISGIDNCEEFIEICKERDLNVYLKDIKDLSSFEDESYDSIICIAVIHHLKLYQDRINVINETIRMLKKGGKSMFMVWAVEQPEKSRRKFKHGDNIVTWKKHDSTIYERYYYIYKKGELEKEFINRDDINVQVSYDYGNHIMVITKL